MRASWILFSLGCLAALPSFAGPREEAQRELAMKYYQGNGRPMDIPKAVALLGQAADGGDAESAIRLGKMYEYGLGVASDEALAARWYTRGAELGAPQSQFEASILYYKGRGVERDPAEAVKWWTLAGASPLGEADWFRVSVQSAEAKLTAAQIEEGRKRAEAWKRAHR